MKTPAKTRRPLVITRGQVAQAASLIGVGALIAGVIGVIWQGGINPLIGGLLALSAAGIGIWAAVTPADFIGFITGKQVRYGTFAAISTMLLIGVVVMVFLFLSRATLTLDMTSNRLYSLSQASLSVIRRVSRPIQITGFYTPSSLPVREIDDQFFRLYSAASDNLIRRVYIDPIEQPGVAQRFGVTDDAQVFISYVSEDGAVDFSSVARVPRGSAQERDMSGALARLLIRGSITVYLNQSLGERGLTDASQNGISGIYNGMQESGLIPSPISITAIAQQNSDIPRDAAALMFVRPTADLSEPQIEVIDRYLNRGGTLLLLIDPTFNDDPFMRADGAFDTYLWENYGIQALDAIIVDAAASGQTPLDIIGANVNTGTDISARLNPAENPLLFRVARAVDVDLERTIPNVANGRLVISSERSYGETDWTALSQTNSYQYDAGVDLPGPLTSVVWATNQRTGAKIVLVGDSDFVSNGLVLTGGNGVLFTDAVAWLTSLDERLDFGIRGFTDSLPLIFVNFQTLDTIAFLTVIVMPALVLIIGAVIWTRRVRQR
jgi:ABC-type uncharacterized transport system involved in gliding motility auxiliary subunit